jgi:hypothetical protein
MTHFIRHCPLAVLLVAIAAGSACSPPPPVREAAPPPPADVELGVAGSLNRMPSLAVSGNRVVAVWTATRDDVMDVLAAVSEDGGATFREPLRVNDTPGDVSSNAEQPPRVAADGATITVMWPSRRQGPSAIRMARSTDGGRTFTAAANLHAGELTGMRGWQALAPGRGGAVQAVWLDGRHAAPSTGQHHHHATRSASTRPASAPRQDVYAATLLPDGTRVESHVARDVCFCCKAAIGVGPGGRISIAWRHIFPDSMRDIAMATSTDGGRTFGPSARISEDNWQLSGCPDDGPAMAVDARDVVHLAWPTFLREAEQKAVFYTRTVDGRSFSPRVRLSSGDREDAGHPQIAVDGAGVIGAVWDEQHGDDRKVVLRRSSGSESFGAPEILNTAGSALNPFVAGLRDGFVVAWPESSDGHSSIRVRHIPSSAAGNQPH